MTDRLSSERFKQQRQSLSLPFKPFANLYGTNKTTAAHAHNPSEAGPSPVEERCSSCLFGDRSLSPHAPPFASINHLLVSEGHLTASAESKCLRRHHHGNLVRHKAASPLLSLSLSLSHPLSLCLSTLPVSQWCLERERGIEGEKRVINSWGENLKESPLTGCDTEPLAIWAGINAHTHTLSHTHTHTDRQIDTHTHTHTQTDTQTNTHTHTLIDNDQPYALFLYLSKVTCSVSKHNYRELMFLPFRGPQ